jgi:hypothetical protein
MFNVGDKVRFLHDKLMELPDETWSFKKDDIFEVDSADPLLVTAIGPIGSKNAKRICFENKFNEQLEKVNENV